MTAPPTRADIEAHFECLISGAMTRDEVDRWAARWVADEAAEVDDDLVWWALERLCGIDLRIGPEGEYLHDEDQIAGWLREFRRQVKASAAGEGAEALM
ncbi:hypothetical protein OIE67_44495 [Nonomuraea fuscirosea]|uniref:hypothetical protein n=1 Tax=Nonomuraea fuscirosea TaxID=1291556 RepID=UPI002DD85262|nr:hypothetical protein [Nonomuraea fuscirosea]WSA51044.1 hypothetical protein OIE67_44495 [Nonomuraea fuscirosea]